MASNPTAEEMDYQYDSRGRLTGATFAQTPYTGFTPGGSNPWYDANHPAQTRARAYYTYDAAGRMINCDHYWDSLVPGTTSYGTSPEIIGNDCVYDTVLGLKTSSTTVDNNTNTPLLGRTEIYTYDSQLDYLASANYYDGLPNANPSWTYDAAANRTDSVCDNLNRTTSIGGTAVTTDILGNRLVYGSSTYSWDALNRMTSLAKSGTTKNYEYRADGMRTHKSSSSTNFTEYFHDAQMSMEDSVVNGSNLTVTRYGLGARGIDYEEVATGTYTNGTTRSVGGFTNVGFPIYDAHGNMVATLARSGSTFTLNNKRSFDAWGQIRNGAQNGDPKNRYCGSLGHQQDDESGLIYMRARYYEPGSGRFISEDPDGQGANWLLYCNDNPLNSFDRTGCSPVEVLGAFFLIMVNLATALFEPTSNQGKCVKTIVGEVVLVIDCAVCALACLKADNEFQGAWAVFALTAMIAGVLMGLAAYQIYMLVLINDGYLPDNHGMHPSDVAGSWLGSNNKGVVF